MLLNILLTIQIIICVALTGVILLQRSEGGALGMGGGGGGGFMTARGAGNFLTRTTAILATLFFIVSAGLTVAGNMARGGSSIVDQGVERVDPNALRPTQPTAPAPEAQLPTGAPADQPSLGDLAAPRPDAEPAPAPAPQQ